MVKAMKVKAENTKRAAARGYLLATDLADYLVRKGEPFRSAHGIVAKLVSYAIGKGKGFSELRLSEYKRFSPLFGQDVFDITVASSIAARKSVGGTAQEQVAAALAAAKKIAGDTRG